MGSRVLKFPRRRKEEARQTIYNNDELDRLDRIQATKGLAKEAWWVIFWPFGFLGGVFGLCGGSFILGLIFGSAIGALFFLLLLSEMRYGKRI